MKDLLIVAAIATIVYALIGSWVFGVLTGLAEESGEDPGLRWLIVLACFVTGLHDGMKKAYPSHAFSVDPAWVEKVRRGIKLASDLDLAEAEMDVRDERERRRKVQTANASVWR